MAWVYAVGIKVGSGIKGRFPRNVFFAVMAICFNFGFAAPCGALSVKTPNIDSAFHDSDVVASITVKDAEDHRVDGVLCGTLYHGTLTRVFKRDGSKTIGTNKVVKFGGADGLRPGTAYLLFLKYIHDTKKMLQQVESDPELKAYSQIRNPRMDRKALRLIECKGLRPGYQFDNRVAWPIENQNILAFALWPKADVPASIKIKHSGPQWVLNAEDVFRYLHKLSKQNEGLGR